MGHAERGWHSLTDPERNVVELVMQGLTNRQIAARLSLSQYTVQTHLKRIYRRLDVARRSELAAMAARWPREPRGGAA